MDKIDGTTLSEFWTASKGFDLFATIGERQPAWHRQRPTVTTLKECLTLFDGLSGLVVIFPLLRALLTDSIFQVWDRYSNGSLQSHKRCLPPD